MLVCNFAQLQFPVSEQLRAKNHSPVRQARFLVNILIIYVLLKLKFVVERALNTINTNLHLCSYVNLI